MSKPIITPFRMLLPPWRLGSNVKSAEPPHVESLSEGAVVAEWAFATVVILGVLAEFVIAALNPSTGSSLGRWGPAFADLLIAGGVAGEVGASMISHICQNDLTRRTNDELAAVVKVNTDLQERLAPRNLSPEQSARISAALRPFAGITFAITTYKDDPETLAFAHQVADAAIAAGWEHLPPIGTPIGLVSGVLVSPNAITAVDAGGATVSDEPNPHEEKAAVVLVETLHGVGIYAVLKNRHSWVVNPRRVCLQIFVGKKP